MARPPQSMRWPLFRIHHPLPQPTEGELLGARVLVIVAPTDTHVDEVRALHAALWTFGVAVVVACETQEAYDEDRRELDPNLMLVEVDPDIFDALVLVGGVGARRVAADPLVRDIAKRFARRGRPVAAVGEGAHVIAAADIDDGIVAAAARDVATVLVHRLRKSPHGSAHPS